MSLSPAQLQQRLEGITATDIAAIVGLHPYVTPIDVFLDKLGRKAPFNGNERTKWGNILEPQIREDYAARMGLHVEVPGTLDHPTVTWAKATPDGICYRPGRAIPERGLEIKTHSFRVAHWYGEPGTDEVPAHELIQCTWNMFVSGLEIWDLVTFIDNQPADYLIRRDDDLIEMLCERGEKFLVDNIRAGNPPEPDGSESYDRYLSTRFSHLDRNETYIAIDTQPEVLLDVRRLREVHAGLDKLTTEEATLEQRLKIAIGNNAGLEWTDFETKKKARIHYKLASDSEKTNWEAAYAELASRCQLNLGAINRDLVELFNANSAEAVEAQTKSTPGTRRFNVPRSWSKKNNKEN